MLRIPAALTYTFGRMLGRTRQGWALYSAMLVLFVAGVGVMYAAEAHATPAMRATGLHGANMQDKEQRFGSAGSALFVAAGTASGDGAANSGVEAFTGLGSAVEPAPHLVQGRPITSRPAPRRPCAASDRHGPIPTRRSLRGSRRCTNPCTAGPPTPCSRMLERIGRADGSPHWLEMVSDGEQTLSRPKQIYTGQRDLSYRSLGERL